jgi:hypothetical protein
MKITLGLNYLNERASERKLVEVEDLFQALAGTGLSHKQLNKVLPYIQNHKWYVSERLGRDVGLRVTAIDFIENVRPSVKTVEPTIVESTIQKKASEPAQRTTDSHHVTRLPT